ncbi:Transmembrane 9 superfamily member 9 [Hibiscus syriacus]|uniref:Transmembrane 9 superfamily member n=1 Tax=Hibiscus syriacus TaxID=106335 RepID=A0A6A3CT35_HIBSY|nr:Transmembrane 9 superfamily member 9 [Hibiscus syriacus]
MESRSTSIRKSTSMMISAILFLSMIHTSHCFYLPGVAPEDFKSLCGSSCLMQFRMGDPLKVKVNKLTSIKTQLPYSYYSLPFCPPPKIVDSAENLGEVLRGDRIENSPYEFKMREPQMCSVLRRITLDAKAAKHFKEKIDDEYRSWITCPLLFQLEGKIRVLLLFISLATMLVSRAKTLGARKKVFIHNHLAFTVKYHRDPLTDSTRIVGFEVKPYSIKHEYEGKWSENTHLTNATPTQNAQLSILTLRKKLKRTRRSYSPMMLNTRYNELEAQEEAQEETGWKLVHGDVFRPPSNSDLLCVYACSNFGHGIRVEETSSKNRMLVPRHRLCHLHCLKYSHMGPEVIWGGTIRDNVCSGSPVVWNFCSTCFCGWLRWVQEASDFPVKINKIPRQIPEQVWYMSSIFSILIGGILPFGATFIELFFILTSIWLKQFYYIFGFLFLVFIILLVTCAEITIVLCYFQLCSEDYLWWWRSYPTSGSPALYLFLYAIFYFFTKLEITKLVSRLLYFGYMLIASYAFFVLTGTIGFYACFWFTRLIYSSVKMD